MDCHDILYRHPWSPEDESNEWPTFALAPPAGQSFYLLWEISQHLLYGLAQKFVQTFIPRGWILVTGDPPTFPLVLPWGWHSSHVRSNKFYLYSPVLQITICLKGLYNLYSIQHSLSLDPRLGWGKNIPQKILLTGKKTGRNHKEEQLRRDPSSRTDRHAIDVKCTE